MANGSGYSRINDASLDKNTSVVVAQKAGYFKGYRVFAATSGTNQVMIKLVKRNLAGTITASSGGSASLSSGAKISLPANGVVLSSSGSAYSGDVNVYASYIDPKASDIAETVPGSFVANDKNGKRVILSSYGMLAVELESGAGEKLQVKSGSVATLTSPIPSSSLSSAPATIALWYVDEQTGVWKEEGTATKQGNNYVGEVKHFSFWNCDLPLNAVSFSVTLYNDKGLPLVNVPVYLALLDTGFKSSSYGYTDSLGQVKGLVPSGRSLLMEVVDPCGIGIYSKNISPLNQNTDLGIITVPNTTSSLTTVIGTLTDCNGLPVKKGYAVINFDNIIRYAATDAAGKFATTFIKCSDDPAFVFSVDETAQQQSSTSIVTVISPVTDVGNISVCGTSAEQFINYTIDGTNYSITSAANDTLTGLSLDGRVEIHGGEPPPGTEHIRFEGREVSTGSAFYSSFLELSGYRYASLPEPSVVTFTKYANVAGEFYEGTLTGKFTNGDTAIHKIDCTFKVRRNN